VKGRPTIGLSGSSVSSSLAAVYRVPVGVHVDSLDSGGGAAAVGIQAGDIITQIDGVSVSGMNQIANIIRSHQVGDTVRVTLWRNNNYYEAQVVLTEQK
jgi:serine protease Do